MFMNNMQVTVQWLDSIADINAMLLKKFIYTSYPLEKNDMKYIHKIQPEILIEMSVEDEVVRMLRTILTSEITRANSNQFGGKLTYIKDKLGLLSEKRKESLIIQFDNKIGYGLLTEKIDTDFLYGILARSRWKNFKSLETCRVLLDLLKSFSLYQIRQGQIPNFILCVLAALELTEDVDNAYFLDALNFIEELRLKDGSFGYDNPFKYQRTNSQKIMDTFYCLWGLKVMLKRFGKYDENNYT